MLLRCTAFLMALAAPSLVAAQTAQTVQTAQVELPPPPPPSQPVAPWGPPPPPPPTEAPVYAPPFGPSPQVPYTPQAPYVAPPPNMPSAADGVPVRFVPALADDDFTVSVVSAGRPSQCRAPCALVLPPGPARVSVRGAADYEQEVFVPPQPTMIRIRRFRVLRLAWALGGVGAGVAMTIAGLSISSAASTCYTSSCDDDSVTGSTLLLLGSALAVVASTTGFTTMGRNRLDIAPDYGLYARDVARGPRLAGFGLSPLREGGAAAGATIAF